jgi:cyclopropane fatty-acyl-phospholipid synthase-like methyltransferase
MMMAFLNDLFQRILTINKWEQRRNLAINLKALLLKPGSRCLDFGCGTDLFAPVFFKSNLKYYGYDIDDFLLQYAARIYGKAQFTSSLDNLKASAPFDLILANCCFHHIESEILDIELGGLETLLADNGTFMMIDILLTRDDRHWLRNQFRKLEKGAFIRSRDDYEVLVKCHFDILQSKMERSHLFSLNNNPIYNDLLVLTCRKYRV